MLYRATATIAQGGTIVTSGSGANCKEAPVGASLSELKSAFEQDAVKKSGMELCQLETVQASANVWDKTKSVSGGVSANGTAQTGSFVHQTIDVEEADVVYLYKSGEHSYFRWVCALDSNGDVVTASGTNTGAWSYTVPSGIKKIIISVTDSFNNDLMVLINDSDTPAEYIPYVEEHQRYIATNEFLHGADLGIVDVDTPIYNTVTENLTNTTGAVLANGTVRTDYTEFNYSQKITVVPGDILYPISNGNDPNFRFVCAYDGNSAVSGKGASSSVNSYTVPDGIDGVIVSISKTLNVTKITHRHKTGEETKAYQINQNLGKTNWNGSLNDGDMITLLESNARFNTIWDFTGHVGTMGKIAIGYKAFSGEPVKIVEVDATKVYYLATTTDFTGEAEHGLSITEDLRIRIVSETDNTLKGIYISSGGQEYSIENTAYSPEMKGSPCLISTGASMTNCAFSWIPRNIDKPIWVFGDSWVSIYNTRWPYYMIQNGYDKSWFLNGFAGEKAEEGLRALKSLLEIRKPDYLVWLYGMNNGDTGSVVNSTWKSVYDEVVEICGKYKINLILYTVPNTPTIKNNYKNAIVVESGYRYIDGVSAVGDDGNGNWFTGYEQSESDHIHTSASGAKALFNRIIADFPEIAGNGI